VTPAVFAGAADGGGIYRLDDSAHLDGVTPIELRVETGTVAPGGISADHAFDWIRLGVTHTAAATLKVTPLVDGDPVPGAAFAISLEAQSKRTSVAFERAIRASVEGGLRTYAPRGTWIAVLIEGMRLGAGDLILDSVDVDYEVLTPTLPSGASVPSGAP
jgi:hypothetical protein